MKLGTQLYVSDSRAQLIPELIEPVSWRHPGTTPGVKPKGCLWTSSWLGEDDGSGWTQWCIGESFGGPEWGNCWLVEPSLDARVYEIDFYSDLEQLIAEYGHTWYLDTECRYSETRPDWVKVAQDFDAVHMTDEGQWRTRGFYPGRSVNAPDLYGWDCESTLWFRWAFESVRDLGPLTFTSLVEELEATG